MHFEQMIAMSFASEIPWLTATGFSEARPEAVVRPSLPPHANRLLSHSPVPFAQDPSRSVPCASRARRRAAGAQRRGRAPTCPAPIVAADFMTDYVDATGGRQVEAKLEGDTWTVVVDEKEVYKVPLAAIEGG